MWRSILALFVTGSVFGVLCNAFEPLTDDNIFIAVNALRANDPNVELVFGKVEEWDVSQVTNMAFLFYDDQIFDSDISKWDVRNVVTMREMFSRSRLFNQDISRWDVSNVKDFTAMFQRARAFSQRLCWDISQDADVSQMFRLSKGRTAPAGCSLSPTSSPSKLTAAPSFRPSKTPSKGPTKSPTRGPTQKPTKRPTQVGGTESPSRAPSEAPSRSPVPSDENIGNQDGDSQNGKNQQGDEEGDSDSNDSNKIGITIGSLAGLIAACSAIAFLVVRRRRNIENGRDKPSSFGVLQVSGGNTTSGAAPGPEMAGVSLPVSITIAGPDSVSPFKHVSVQEQQAAPGNREHNNFRSSFRSALFQKEAPV